MARFLSAPPYELRIDQEMVTVTSDSPTVSPSWRFKDASGHKHMGLFLKRTLQLVVTEERWCDGCEGLYNHDPHMLVVASHYECRFCGEVIEPGMLAAGTPKFIPGLTTATLTARRFESDTMMEYTYYADDDDIHRLHVVHPEDRDEVVWDIIDTALREQSGRITMVMSRSRW